MPNLLHGSLAALHGIVCGKLFNGFKPEKLKRLHSYRKDKIREGKECAQPVDACRALIPLG